MPHPIALLLKKEIAPPNMTFGRQSEFVVAIEGRGEANACCFDGKDKIPVCGECATELQLCFAESH